MMNINKTFSVIELADWIRALMEDAKKDEQFSIAWFDPTKDKPFSIIGGWMGGFSEDYSDLLCISKSEPTYAMCIKIAVNEGPYAYTDFEVMNMPLDPETNGVDDTCIALEHEEDYEAMAIFFLNEWERIMKAHGEEV